MADNPFEDDFADIVWDELDDIDYDSIFTDTGTKKGKQINKQLQNHTMTVDDLCDAKHSEAPSIGTPSFVSSNILTPPPLPSIDTDSTLNDKLNDDFWNNLIDSSTTLTPIITPSRTKHSSSLNTTPSFTRSKSVIEQTRSSISTLSTRCSSIQRSRSIQSVPDPSDLAFGIQLNTPKKAQSVLTTSKKKRNELRKRKKRNKKRKASAKAEGNELDVTLRKLEEKNEDQFNHEHRGSHSFQSHRRSSYIFGCQELEFDACTFDVKSVINMMPTDLFEVGKIVDVLRGKQHGWTLQKYLCRYTLEGTTSPIFEITHPTKGKHLILGVYPRFKDVSQFLKHHPLFSMLEKYGIDTVYTPVKYTKKSGFNYSLQTLITASANVTVESLNVLNEEYTIINKEFHRQCEKLFDKILYGKGFWKKIPGVDSVFITHWNTFMRKYRMGVESCYLNGDLKGYCILVCIFWCVVLRFKKQNRCKDLSKVLSARMSYRIANNLDKKLEEKDRHSSITLVSLNLLFRPKGVFRILKELGWEIKLMDEEKVANYRKRNDCTPNELETLQTNVRKVGKHAGKVMSWSRNRGESCIVM